MEQKEKIDLFSNATNTVGATMVGQNIGAKEYRRVPKILLSVFAITFVCCLGLSVIMFNRLCHRHHLLFIRQMEDKKICSERITKKNTGRIAKVPTDMQFDRRFLRPIVFSNYPPGTLVFVFL